VHHVAIDVQDLRCQNRAMPNEEEKKPGEEKRWSHTMDYYGPGDSK
jgi:hypothetical protein